MALLLLVCGCEDELEIRELELDGSKVTLKGLIFGEGNWQATVSGFQSEMKPGDPVKWQINFSIRGDHLTEVMSNVEKIEIALAAHRICDAQGHFRQENAYFASTYLTPSGLPIEGFQYLIANSKIGGPYKTPLDLTQSVDLNHVVASDDSVRFQSTIQTRLAEDFPPGLYRIEIAFFASYKGYWIKLPLLPAMLPAPVQSDLNFEEMFLAKTLLPPMRIGQIKSPRMIWTLFTTKPSHGVSGVVAREDAQFFAISNRVKLPTRYILPCRPDRRQCVYRIEPDFPTIDTKEIFSTRNSMPYQPIEIYPISGELTVEVKRPDGKLDELGSHPLHEYDVYGNKTTAKELDYHFDQFGMYEIRMIGHLFDRFGNRFEAGGTYEVWVAYPLTFSTGMKPGNPMSVGKFYPPAATINPPVPANVKATVTFYPGTHPADVQQVEYKGTAQKFGYFYPDAGQEMFRFPETGEYLVDFFASYIDSEGRVYMGHMKNASVVTDEEPGMQVVGFPIGVPPNLKENYKESVYALDGKPAGIYYILYFPENSGDTLSFAGHAPLSMKIQPAMSVVEPSGYLHDILGRHFPPRLVSLFSKTHQGETMFLTEAFPGCQEQIRLYIDDQGKSGKLPIFSTTSKGYSPFSFPELVDRRGYFYFATSRPGFPIFFAVGDSSMLDNYWSVRNDYMKTIGAANHGDQPGDINWSVVTALFADHESETGFYGRYGTGAVALPRGVYAEPYSPPFKHPVANINGVDLYIYGGVGPSPGTMYETGAIKGVGSVAIPMTPHEIQINIVKPSGDTHACSGRADFLGNFTCPSGPLILDQPGVYRVFARFWEKDREGTCVGASDGWYQIYCVKKDSPYRVVFDSQTPRRISYDQTVKISGSVEPAMAKGKAYYSIVTPGILMDEGTLPLKNGRFVYSYSPNQFGAQFINFADHSQQAPVLPGHEDTFLELVKGAFPSPSEKRLSDTVEFVVFIEGENDDGQAISAGAKLIFRGNRVIIPAQFSVDAGGHK